MCRCPTAFRREEARLEVAIFMISASRRGLLALGGAACGLHIATSSRPSSTATAPLPAKLVEHAETDVVVENWSSTHTASPVHYFQPTSAGAVQQILSLMHEAGARLRVVGSALSPNGLGLSDEAMLNMVQCDAVLSVDVEARQATVQAGARVADVVEALRPHGLTLQNYASIAEQQIGGFLQVGAHGTGAGVPPVDEQIVRMVLHTPALGALELSADKNPRLFHLARVSLGWLGVVSEVTIQCVPAHKLLQHTYTQTREEVARLHTSNLRHQHMRYMWIPHTDTVVVVTLDPVPEGAPIPAESESALASKKGGSAAKAIARAPERELRDLLLQKSQAVGTPKRPREVEEMNFAQLRDALLAIAPLDKQHVIEVNRAEAAFWRASEGYRVDWSDKLLGFECGGQQWVSEVVFPCGTRSEPNGADLRYMEELLALIEASELPTPAPIEQRWTLRSKSTMSPAHSAGEDDLHSWVGIIMYLPTQEEEQRSAITRRFWEYNQLCREKLWSKFGCHQHWAKIELPDDEEGLRAMRRRLAERFPLEELYAAKQKLDPKGVLGNALVDTLFLPEHELQQRTRAVVKAR